jgi:hypothetical protein
MQALNAAQLLEVWERGVGQSLPRRARALLVAAHPEWSDEDLATMTIGQCNAALLRLREKLFGSEFRTVADCPACAAQLESTFSAADIEPESAVAPAGEHALEVDGYRIAFRLPTSCDAVVLTDGVPEEDPVRALLDRCLLRASDPAGTPLTAAALPDVVVAAVASQMAFADSQADVQLTFSCPTCGHHWQALFDITGFLWKEIHAWAQRTLRDVDHLASAYGWRESDVLALSPSRRQIYVELSRQ